MDLKKFGNWLEDLGPSGVILGIGAMVITPIVIPSIAKVSKPLAKVMIKSGIIAYQKSRIFMVKTGEIIEDLVVEVQAEIASQQELSTRQSSNIKSD